MVVLWPAPFSPSGACTSPGVRSEIDGVENFDSRRTSCASRWAGDGSVEWSCAGCAL